MIKYTVNLSILQQFQITIMYTANKAL